MINSDKNNEKIFTAVICGPTASGKTDLGVKFAQRLDGEIISADSMQIYKGMDIASAKPSEEEMGGIPHYMIDFLPPNKPFSVADYVEQARKCIDDIHSRGKLPIIVGGTGLYISSLINNIKFDDTGSDFAFREKAKKFAEEKGNDALWRELNKVDPVTALRLHPNNLNRVIRALEVYHISGSTISSAQQESRREDSPYRACYIMPDYSRDVLYERINNRVDVMLEKGLLAEADEFFSHKDYVTAVQAIGYKELKPYFDREKSLEECVARLKQATRNYAKRQLTWFNKTENLNRIPSDNGITDDIIKKFVLC
ncbi:MAG: tRNA (adenosine(37)-N6)-dimethylallyltransferase MiaA [Firmicutes bacterium]|nr:tRNA (adenosine(37)-N6)-dimethylallyltransferase MiaA [[Eubacterium] siraeum]MCM1486905.1 tRNA (adenosine(37)-N6)-dimethylallyltransferase MiaA [Bacillota bacterium]